MTSPDLWLILHIHNDKPAPRPLEVVSLCPRVAGCPRVGLCSRDSRSRIRAPHAGPQQAPVLLPLSGSLRSQGHAHGPLGMGLSQEETKLPPILSGHVGPVPAHERRPASARHHRRLCPPRAVVAAPVVPQARRGRLRVRDRHRVRARARHRALAGAVVGPRAPRGARAHPVRRAHRRRGGARGAQDTGRRGRRPHAGHRRRARAARADAAAGVPLSAQRTAHTGRDGRRGGDTGVAEIADAVCPVCTTSGRVRSSACTRATVGAGIRAGDGVGGDA